MKLLEIEGVIELCTNELKTFDGGFPSLEYWEALGDALRGRNSATNLATFAQYDSLYTSIWQAMKML